MLTTLLLGSFVDLGKTRKENILKSANQPFWALEIQNLLIINTKNMECSKKISQN